VKKGCDKKQEKADKGKGKAKRSRALEDSPRGKGGKKRQPDPRDRSYEAPEPAADLDVAAAVMEIDQRVAEAEGGPGPSRRRRVYGEEERVTEVDDDQWVKVTNDLVMAIAETNQRLAETNERIGDIAERLDRWIGMEQASKDRERGQKAEDRRTLRQMWEEQRDDRRVFMIKTAEILEGGLSDLRRTLDPSHRDERRMRRARRPIMEVVTTPPGSEEEAEDMGEVEIVDGGVEDADGGVEDADGGVEDAEGIADEDMVVEETEAERSKGTEEAEK